MGLLAWLIFGALAGWVASLIMGTSQRQGCLMNIIVGVAGAFVGGFIMQLATGRGIAFGFDLASFLVAVVGAIVLLAIFGAARRGRY
jgi:uncharacterized membrane protein YeaQ/YmgE (transglycosylase-associated protein family)